MKYSYNEKKSLDRVKKVLLSGKVNYWTGKENNLFEKEFSNYIGNKYSVAVSNGSVALEIALRSLNLNSNDEVLVTPRSFIISASCVLNVGLKPVFADVNDNGNMFIDGILKAYNKNIKVIILVHLNGLSCDLDPILKFCKKNKIYIIEDCSQAHGAIYKNRKVGSFGHISTWSFCQDKIISTGGEGGMISTNNRKIWEKCWSYKDHGKNYKKVFYKKHKAGFRWLHDSLGSNFRMTEIQAALGREQLKSLDNQINKRNLIANLYINGLKNYYLKYDFLKKPDFKCQQCPTEHVKTSCKLCKHAFYRLNLFINKKKINQIKLIKQLNKNKINCIVGACPEIYMEKVFKKFDFKKSNRLSNAKYLGETSLVFPINPYKSIKDYKKDLNLIIKCFNKYI